jgi:hypothetical protein
MRTGMDTVVNNNIYALLVKLISRFSNLSLQGDRTVDTTHAECFGAESSVY